MIVVSYLDLYSRVVKRKRIFARVYFACAFDAVDEQRFEHVETCVRVKRNRNGIADFVTRFVKSHRAVSTLYSRCDSALADNVAERSRHAVIRNGIGKTGVPPVSTDSANRIAAVISKAGFVFL